MEIQINPKILNLMESNKYLDYFITQENNNNK